MTDILREGDTDPRVAEVRAILARLGLLPDFAGDATETGSAAQWSPADTIFDADLVDPLRAFQQSRGIHANGAINEPTLRALREASYELGNRVLAYEPTAQLAGDDVGQLQDQLQELGFYAGRIDGRYGPETYQAVRRYQNDVGLEPDGVCGPRTLRQLSYLGRRITGGSPSALREREQVRAAGPRLQGKRVVIDPGRGGTDPGLTVPGPYGPVSEEEILWDLASRVEGRMVAVGVETIVSRPRQENPTPADRAEIANAFGADLVVSLAADRYPNHKANGVATYYFGSTYGKNSMVGQLLSGFIQREIVARTPLGDSRTHARTWDLLRLTRMPAVEVVLGYFTNPDDLAVLTDPDYRDTLAEAIVVAVKRLYLLDQDTAKTGTYLFAELLADENVGE